MHKLAGIRRTENRKIANNRRRGGACPSRRYTADSHRPPSKRRWPPTGSVAVFPERPVGDIQPQKCSGAPLHRPDVSLRGGRRPTWQSREGTHDFADRFPTIQSGAARLHPKGTSSRFALRAPRRLAPHNDKSGVITVLTGACTSRQRCAGSGMPLPYNSGCGRRNCFKICNCQWRSGSAATDAIGLCVFAGSLYELQVPAVFRLRILPPVRQRMRNRQNYGKFLCFFIMACYNESAE